MCLAARSTAGIAREHAAGLDTAQTGDVQCKHHCLPAVVLRGEEPFGVSLPSPSVGNRGQAGEWRPNGFFISESGIGYDVARTFCTKRVTVHGEFWRNAVARQVSIQGGQKDRKRGAFGSTPTRLRCCGSGESLKRPSLLQMQGWLSFGPLRAHHGITGSR